ncbi:MAG: GAF domain-containing protein [Actinomycetota bacterium]
MTHRAVDLDVAVRVDLTVERAAALATTVTSATYHMILVFVGVQDVLEFTCPKKWSDRLAGLLDSLSDTRVPPEIVFVAIPPPSHLMGLPSLLRSRIDAHADALNEAARSIVATRPGSRFVPFLPARVEEAHRHRSPKTYDRWAEQLAHPIGESVSRIHKGGGGVDEAERQAAIEGLDILDTPPDESFDRIMRLARDLFGAPAAAISFIDRDRLWFKSKAGFAASETAREDAFCDHTIRQAGAFVVCDASLDVRFVDNRFVNDGTHLRFYAGYPLEGADGQRVGALCIFDTVARTFDARDTALLRSLALLVQEQLSRANDTSPVLH